MTTFAFHIDDRDALFFAIDRLLNIIFYLLSYSYDVFSVQSKHRCLATHLCRLALHLMASLVSETERQEFQRDGFLKVESLSEVEDVSGKGCFVCVATL